jgi:hypothetical protein
LGGIIVFAVDQSKYGETGNENFGYPFVRVNRRRVVQVSTFPRPVIYRIGFVKHKELIS